MDLWTGNRRDFPNSLQKEREIQEAPENSKELHSKIHKQEAESFSEFRCHEVSQDHGETVAKAMGSQDDSYRYITNNTQK